MHLTHQANLDTLHHLDTLHLDDRISTGRIGPAGRADPDPLLERCGQLADAVYDWWDHQPPPIVYRSRTTPTGRNVAFTATATPEPLTAGRLRDATALHVHLVLRLGFTVPADWLRRTPGR